MDVTAVAVTSVESGTRADEMYRPGAWTRCTGLARGRDGTAWRVLDCGKGSARA